MIISVVIPTCNPDQYLLDCLSSLDKQILSKRDYEICLVLNGDKEPYWEMIDGYIEMFPDLQIVKMYSEKKGVSYARNIALDYAKGDYICFIDDDDIVSPNYLSGLMEVVGEKGMVVASNLGTFVDDISNLGEDYISKWFVSVKSSNIFISRKFMSCAGMKLIPREVIGERRFNPNFKNGEDSIFMFLISDRVCGVKRSSADVFYYRRIRIDSASRVNKGKLFYIKNSINAIIEYSKCYFHNPFHYNFLFFVSRVLAAILSAVKKM